LEIREPSWPARQRVRRPLGDGRVNVVMLMAGKAFFVEVPPKKK
jgi:hypothetical protein